MNRFMSTLALVLLCAWTTASAQNRTYERGGDYQQTRADLNFVFAIPQGDFEDNLDEIPVGASLFLGGRVPNSPIVLGTELAFLNYGTTGQLELFDYEGIPVSVVGLGTSNNMAMGHLVARIQPQTGAIQPFIDLLAGVRYYNTRARLESDIILFRNGLSGAADLRSDWAFSAGAGAGLDLNLYRGPMGFNNEEGSVALNIGARYLFGTEAEYATELRQHNGGVSFDEVESRTDLIQPQLGLRVKL